MRRFAVLLLLSWLMSLLAACNPFPKTWEWNQKLTLEVETPQGELSNNLGTGFFRVGDCT